MSDFSTITYLHTAEEFYDKEKLRAFAEGLAAQGYHVAGEDRREVRQVWTATLNGEEPQIDSPDVKSVFTPLVSVALQDDITAFVDERSDLLAIYLFSTARDGDLQAFEATLYLEPEEFTITMSMLARPDVLSPFLNWMDLLQFTYEFWHPLYSYEEGGVEETTHKEALAGNITRLYQVNLLNSEMVEALGRERVLSTRAWRVTELKDGSVFLVPQLIYNGGGDEDYTYHREEAASHLGLSVA